MSTAEIKKLSIGELRIQKDLDEMVELDGIEIELPDPENVLLIHIIIKPSSGYWKGGRFVFEFKIPEDYPFRRPSVKCLSVVWHPNIEITGAVCVSTLREEFTAVVTLETMAVSLLSLFYSPNPHDPLNQDAAKQMTENEPAFAIRAQEYILTYDTK